MGTAGTEAYHANSVSDSLLAPPWQLLLSRIGDTLMLYLLLHVSMFSCLGNDTCLQLAGPSAVTAVRSFKRAAAVPQLAEDVRFRFRRGGRAAAEAEWAADEAEGRGGPGTQEPFSGQSPREPAQQAQQQDDAMEVEAPKARRRRPPSWQRRKALAAAEATSAAAAAQGGSPSAPRQGDDAEVPLEDDLPATQPLDEMEAEPQAAAATAPPPDDVRCYSQWPRYMLKPSEMVINRIVVFYSSSFPSKAGFPAKREPFKYICLPPDRCPSPSLNPVQTF